MLSPCGAYAAVGNGCDESDDNEYVNPELALCSTHVYNIGGIENPDNDAKREMMKDVVALKTTVMTQQMYKQYEYLESMMKRFKTQLEKAVLTTKLQAAGASTGTTSSSSSGMYLDNTGTTSSRVGSNKYVVLNDAKNCSLEPTITSALQCLLDNISITLSAVDNGNTSGAKRQLDADKEIAQKLGVTLPDDCKSISNSVKSVSGCAYSLRLSVMQQIETKQQKHHMQGWHNQGK